MKFRKKPVTVEAWPFYGNRTDVVHCVMPEWMRDAIASGSVYYQGGYDPYYTIKTPEGTIRARVGDWIIRGVAGEIYPMKDEIFKQTYEAAE